MNLEQLEYIVEVAKAGSISIAALQLHVSQAAISQSITNLEDELGIKIFERSRRLGSIPTEKGKQIIKKAYEITIKVHELKTEAHSEKNIITGKLKMAAIPSFLMTFLPKAIADFKTTYPQVDIEITEKVTQDILEDIENDKIDLGFIATNNSMRKEHVNLEFEELLNGQIEVCVSKNSPLAFSDILTPEELIECPIVMYKGATLQAVIHDFFKEVGDLNILFSSNNTKVIQKTVADGLAISFFFDLTLKNEHYIKNGDIIAIPLSTDEQEQISYGWVHLKRKNLSFEAKEFLKYLHEQLSEDSF